MLPEISPAKEEGIEAISQGDYSKAIVMQTSLQNQKNDPEALIYLNNARIGAATSYTIAASVPIGSDPDVRESRQLWVGDVSWRTALAYDATVALIAAIAQDPTRVGVQQALLSPKFSPPGAKCTIFTIRRSQYPSATGANFSW